MPDLQPHARAKGVCLNKEHVALAITKSLTSTTELLVTTREDEVTAVVAAARHAQINAQMSPTHCCIHQVPHVWQPQVEAVDTATLKQGLALHAGKCTEKRHVLDTFPSFTGQQVSDSHQVQGS
jgi:hypothetical protein